MVLTNLGNLVDLGKVAVSWQVWGAFLGFVFVMLALDLLVFHRKDKAIELRDALFWSGAWIAIALAAMATISWYFHSSEVATVFLTGYLLEFSLSIDNLFVFLVIFSFFHVAEKYMHRVLFWGILGAIFFRAIFILGGVALVNAFSWIIYIFAIFLVFTGAKLIFSNGHDEKESLENNWLIKKLSRWERFSPTLHGHDFFFWNAGKCFITPLLLVLIVIEFSDVLFAVDSVPAILGILPANWSPSLKMFVAFSSNIFAILGLRSFFFALERILKMLRFLHFGLAILLIFIGVKLALAQAKIWEPGFALSLVVMVVVLGITVLASIAFPQKKSEKSLREQVENEGVPANKSEREVGGNANGGNAGGNAKPWIGVDLDGTLAEYRASQPISEIGKPVPVMLERVKFWLEKGFVVKIFTARATLGDEQISLVKKWLADNNLPELEVTNVKDFAMIELWDDRAIQVVQNSGKPFLAQSIVGRPSAPILPNESASETFYLLKK